MTGEANLMREALNDWRVLPGEWVPWDGSGVCPVDPNTMVEIKVVMEAGDEPRVFFKRSAWASIWDDSRVVAYRVAS